MSLLVQLLDHLCQAFYICINLYSDRKDTDENDMKTKMWTVLLDYNQKSIEQASTVRMGINHWKLLSG